MLPRGRCIATNGSAEGAGGHGTKLGARMPGMVLASIGGLVVCGLAALWLRLGASRRRAAATRPRAPEAGARPPTAQPPTAQFPAAQFPTAQFPAVPPYAVQTGQTGPTAQAAPGYGYAHGQVQGQHPYPLDLGVRETYTVGGGPSGMAALSAFAALSLVGAVVSLRTHTQTGGGPVALFIGLPFLALVVGVLNLLRRRRLPRRLVLHGHVARLWTVRADPPRGAAARNNAARGGAPRDLEHYFCLLHCPLDDGQAPEGVRLKLNQTVYRRLYEGQLIEVLVAPRQRRIKDLRSIEGGG